MLKSKFKILSLMMAGTLISGTVIAQQPSKQVPQQQQQKSVEVTDEDLDNVVKIQKKVQKVNKKAQPKMVEAIQEAGMETQEFLAMSKAEKQGTQADDVDEEKLKQYESAKSDIQVIQSKAQKEIMGEVESAGYTQQEYSQIYMAIQQSPDLQQKIQEKMKM